MVVVIVGVSGVGVSSVVIVVVGVGVGVVVGRVAVGAVVGGVVGVGFVVGVVGVAADCAVSSTQLSMLTESLVLLAVFVVAVDWLRHEELLKSFGIRVEAGTGAEGCQEKDTFLFVVEAADLKNLYQLCFPDE